MNFLFRFEEILLIAIWKLGDDAYGATILKQIEKDTGTKLVSGAVYGALTRILKNGYVKTIEKKVRSEGAGRPRVYYKITSDGLKKLVEIQEMNKSLWEGIPDLKREV